jgi:hypothetical protein
MPARSRAPPPARAAQPFFQIFCACCFEVSVCQGRSVSRFFPLLGFFLTVCLIPAPNSGRFLRSQVRDRSSRGDDGDGGGERREAVAAGLHLTARGGAQVSASRPPVPTPKSRLFSAFRFERR